MDGALPQRHRTGQLAPASLCLTALLITGCAAGQHSTDPAGDAASTVARLGAVPIPTATGSPGALPASPGHPQLLPIGGAVLARLPDGSATVTVLGPAVDRAPGDRRPIEDADATITVRTEDTLGNIVPRPAEFTVRDDHGRDITLSTAPGADHDAAGPHTAMVALTGHFHAGSTCSRNVSPAAVSATLRPSRSNSATPSSLSSLRIWTERDGWARNNSSAARVKVPACATAYT